MTKPHLRFALIAALCIAGCDSSSGKITYTDGGKDTPPGTQTGTSTTSITVTSTLTNTSTTTDGGGRLDGAGTTTITTTTTTTATTKDAGVDVPVTPTDGGAPDVLVVYPDTGLMCRDPGAVCSSNLDCCKGACVAGLCSAEGCVSDGTPCSTTLPCCSQGACGANGMCPPANPGSTCKTVGNACDTNAECCGGLCNTSGRCEHPSKVSFCSQVGDLCRADRECCTGVCAIASGASVGTCATISTSCQVDGTVCKDCSNCCSHFCGPYGKGGPKICQPASGCHVQGDLCHKDSDCCGGDVTSGLPGSGLIKCEFDPTYGSRIGTCGGPKASNCPDKTATCKNACNPEGNVCHYKNTLVCGGNLTNVRNDCCDCIPGKECCLPDATGIPRCNSLAACVPVGGRCSFSGECCDGHPCLPDPVTGLLACGAQCVPAGGACTTNADCCTGIACIPVPGQVAGVCGVPVTPPPPPPADGGTTPPPADAGQQPDAPLVCGLFGQSCSTSSLCCDGMTCITDFDSGRECTAGDTGCFCFVGE